MARLWNINRFLFFTCILFVSFLFSCKEEKKESGVKIPEKKITAVNRKIPIFNKDSAYAYIEKQVAFGPRVPGSKAHANCAVYFKDKFTSFGLQVIEQNAPAVTYDKKKYSIKNIIASYAPEKKERIMLCAHWDSRPIADRDTKDKDKPIDGANDGASGAGVLMEIARQLKAVSPSVGVDIILFDIEDYGQPNNSGFPEMEDSWCLGSQYWSKNPHKPGYTARYGILLDMVGAPDATFCLEGGSEYYAPLIQRKVWQTADDLGFSDFFVNIKSGPITDDHTYINELIKIPTIDIIHMDTNTGDFGSFHHRHSDNMTAIDKNTLYAVGQTLLQVLYTE